MGVLGLLLFALLLVSGRRVMADQNEKSLYRDIFNEYDPLERPTSNASLPVTIMLSVALQQLINVDAQNQIITVNAWLKYTWRDVHLTWEPKDYGGITDVRIPDGKIWRPDVLLYNSVDVNFDSTFPTNFVVYNDGLVNWIPPGIFKISCKINIKWFPFDEQRCFFKFGSWTYDGTKIDLQPDPEGFDISDYIQNGEWSLIEATLNRSVKYYKCCPEPYPDLKFYLLMRRRTLYFAVNLVIPCILILLMTIVGFTLPPEAGEKISLQITVMLSICIFLQLVGTMTPPTSEAVPLLGVFFSCCMFVVSASVVFTVVVLNLHYRTPETYQMSNLLRVTLLHWLPWLMNMKRPGYNFSKKSLPALFPSSNDVDNKYDDQLLTALKGVYDLLYNVASYKYVVDVVASDDEKGSKTDTDLEHRISNCLKLLATNAQNLKIEPYETATLLMIQRIYSELKYITKKMGEEEDDKFCESEWKFAAMVVDRFCLIVFSLFIIASTLGIFGSAPYLVA